jgi:hypothetical protein
MINLLRIHALVRAARGRILNEVTTWLEAREAAKLRG